MNKIVRNENERLIRPPRDPDFPAIIHSLCKQGNMPGVEDWTTNPLGIVQSLYGL